MKMLQFTTSPDDTSPTVECILMEGGIEKTIYLARSVVKKIMGGELTETGVSKIIKDEQGDLFKK